ncbi:uncharacterized protein LOC141613659 [Silene latifolia]|uniref:uncharacterized protein LOC141613659 n=1 Tax=Silene latifolia TaxID=37657 RepID=UPI003D78AF8A
MSSFLTPTSYSGVDFKLLSAVEDVDSITQYDWCTYVLENLVKAAADTGENKQTLLGCIPFLMITYFQRFDFRGESCRHTLPLIKHWDRQTLSDRLHGELDKSRLGRLTWSVVKYPRCLQKELLSIGGVPDDSQVLAIGNVVRDTTLQVTSSSDRKKFIEIELPSGVDNDEELKARAVDDVHELYLKMQRNATVFYSWYADATMTLKRLTGGMNHPSDPVATQCTQSFFQSQRMKDYAVEMQEIAERINRSVKSAPVLQQSPGDEVQNDEVDDDGYEQHVGDDDEEEDNGDEDEGDDEDVDNVGDEEDFDDMEDDGSDNEKEVTADLGRDREGPVAASIVSDDAASEKALEVCTQQIMEAVQYYGSAEFTDTAHRDEYNKDTDMDVGSTREISVIYRRRKAAGKQVAVKEPPKFDREALEDIYSKEELDEAEKKFYANAAAENEEEQTMDLDVHVAGDNEIADKKNEAVEEQTMDLDVHVAGDNEIADKKNEDDGPTDAVPPVTQARFRCGDY